MRMRRCSMRGISSPDVSRDCTRFCAGKDCLRDAGASTQTRIFHPGRWKRSTGCARRIRSSRMTSLSGRIWGGGWGEVERLKRARDRASLIEHRTGLSNCRSGFYFPVGRSAAGMSPRGNARSTAECGEAIQFPGCRLSKINSENKRWAVRKDQSRGRHFSSSGISCQLEETAHRPVGA